MLQRQRLLRWSMDVVSGQQIFLMLPKQNHKQKASEAKSFPVLPHCKITRP